MHPHKELVLKSHAANSLLFTICILAETHEVHYNTWIRLNLYTNSLIIRVKGFYKGQCQLLANVLSRFLDFF